MNPTKLIRNLMIVVLLGMGVGLVFVAKRRQACPPPSAPGALIAEPAATVPAAPTRALPRLVDLGANKCIPCRMMAPILEDLKKTYAGKLEVEFIDVWADPAAGQQYGIRVIPTQVFLAADGRELFRHEGFYSKEDILATWKNLGVQLD